MNDGEAPKGCGNQILLDKLSATLIDLFVVDAGIIVVDSAGVQLIGRDTQVLKSIPFTKQITTAAFDGTTLVVTDADELTVMTPELDLGSTASTTESCASAVMVSQNRFICGPSKDSKRVFYTYNVGVNPPLQIATSSEYSYNGIPMRRVPGMDSFVTVENNNEPPGFSLFTVSSATGEASLGGSSPFDDYQLYTGQSVAFDGSPATHMIQADGNMLSLTGSGCDGSELNSQSCFQSSGLLGVLSSEQSYVGLGDDGAGKLLALVMQIADFHLYQPPCANGCHIQVIDIASRSILQQETFTSADLWSVVRMTYDVLCGDVIIGSEKFDQSEFNLSKGYKVQSFGF